MDYQTATTETVIDLLKERAIENRSVMRFEEVGWEKIREMIDFFRNCRLVVHDLEMDLKLNKNRFTTGVQIEGYTAQYRLSLTDGLEHELYRLDGMPVRREKEAAVLTKDGGFRGFQPGKGLIVHNINFFGWVPQLALHVWIYQAIMDSAQTNLQRIEEEIRAIDRKEEAARWLRGRINAEINKIHPGKTTHKLAKMFGRVPGFQDLEPDRILEMARLVASNPDMAQELINYTKNCPLDKHVWTEEMVAEALTIAAVKSVQRE